MTGIEEIEAPPSIAQYLSESAASDLSLSTWNDRQWVLRPEVAFYGCPFCQGEH